MIVTALSLSTVFCVAFEFDYKGRPIPYLHLTLCTLTALLGVVNHYLVPHTRKETPWICIAQPLLKAKEYGQFEATGWPGVHTRLHVCSTAQVGQEYTLGYMCVVCTGWPGVHTRLHVCSAAQVGQEYTLGYMCVVLHRLARSTYWSHMLMLSMSIFAVTVCPF